MDQVKNMASLSQEASEKSPISREVLLGLALVLFCAALMFFTKLGAYPLFNPDEGLYAEPAREMIETGEYVTSLLNYVWRFTKPPLFMWVMAGCYQVFGVNEFAARFPGAACALILVAVTYLFTQRFIGLRAAVFAAFSLISAPLFVGVGREAITDMPLSLLMASAMLAYFVSYETKRSLWSIVGHVLVGLAVMTKGPVAVVLTGAILVVYHFLTGDLKKAFFWHKPLIGALIILVIAVPWFAIEISVTKGAYFQEFIMRENFARFTSVVDSHKGPIWYHLAAMFGGFFPWSLFLPGALISLAAVFKNKAKKLFGVPISAVNFDQHERIVLYCVVWTLVTVGFFSASVSKLLPYTIPAFPAIAILVGGYVAGASKKSVMIPLAVLTVIFSVAAFVFAYPGASHPLRFLKDAPLGLSLIIARCLEFLLCGAIVSLVLVRLKNERVGLAVFTLFTVISLLYFGGKLLPVLSDNWEGPLPEFARFAAASNEPVIIFDMRKPGAPFYTRRKVINAPDKDILSHSLKANKSAFVIAKARDSEYLRGIDGTKVVASKGNFLLVHWMQGGVKRQPMTNSKDTAVLNERKK